MARCVQFLSGRRIELQLSVLLEVARGSCMNVKSMGNKLSEKDRCLRRCGVDPSLITKGLSYSNFHKKSGFTETQREDA